MVYVEPRASLLEFKKGGPDLIVTNPFGRTQRTLQATEVSIINPSQAAVCAQAAHIPGYAARLREEEKALKYNQAVNANNMTLVPAVIEAHGAFGPELLRQLAYVADKEKRERAQRRAALNNEATLTNNQVTLGQADNRAEEAEDCDDFMRPHTFSALRKYHMVRIAVCFARGRAEMAFKVAKAARSYSGVTEHGSRMTISGGRFQSGGPSPSASQQTTTGRTPTRAHSKTAARSTAQPMDTDGAHQGRRPASGENIPMDHEPATPRSNNNQAARASQQVAQNSTPRARTGPHNSTLSQEAAGSHSTPRPPAGLPMSVDSPTC